VQALQLPAGFVGKPAVHMDSREIEVRVASLKLQGVLIEFSYWREIISSQFAND
jgi:hypothetical protein